MPGGRFVATPVKDWGVLFFIPRFQVTRSSLLRVGLGTTYNF